MLHLAARPGATAPWPNWVPPAAITAWQSQGIESPWVHQFDAAQGLVRGTPRVLQVSAVDGRNLADGFRWCCEGGVEVERT